MTDMHRRLSLLLTALLLVRLIPANGEPASAATTDEVADLKRTIAALGIALNRCREQQSGYGTNAVQAPFGRFLLIKAGKDAIALKITEHTRRTKIQWDGGRSVYSWLGARYEWLYQPDGSMDFSKPNVERGAGEFIENREQMDPSTETVRIGSLALRWSTSDWVYFPKNADRGVQMARSEWVRTEDIDFQDKSLGWIWVAHLRKLAERRLEGVGKLLTTEELERLKELFLRGVRGER